MSGRRRRDDGWEDRSRDTWADPDASRDTWADSDDSRDPWADSSVDEWADQDRDQRRGADRGKAAGSGAAADRGKGTDRGQGVAGAYPSNGTAAPAAAAPAFPSFTLGGGNGRKGPDPAGGAARGQGAGYGDGRPAPAGRRGGANGAQAGYSPASRRDSGYGDAGYGDPGYGDPGYGAGRGANGDGYRDTDYRPDSRSGQDPSPGRGAGRGNGQGYGSPDRNGDGRMIGTAQAPEFTPVDNDEAEDGPAGTPRPIGRLSIYTLREDKTKEFDLLAERAAEGVRESEPDTLVYVIHIVPKAPTQRIMYEVYRDRAAFLGHEQQPHIRQFAVDRASCVLATNVIDLRLKYAKVAALGSAAGAPRPQPGWGQGAAEFAAEDNRFQAPATQRVPAAQYEAAAQYEPAPRHQPTPRYQPAPAHEAPQYEAAAQYEPVPRYDPAPQYERTQQYQGAQYGAGQYSAGPYQGEPTQRPAAASFTPARDQYPAGNQHAATGREHYPTIAQFDNPGNGTYRGGNAQYGASNGYSPAAANSNGGSYSSGNGYQSSNGYSNGNGYEGGSDDSKSAGYSNGAGYAGYSNGAGYANGDGYSNGAGYANGDGYSSSGYQNGNGYSGGYGAAARAADYGPDAVGEPTVGRGVPTASRQRELTSGSAPAGQAGYPDTGDRYSNGGRQSAKASDWEPRPQDQR